jgi:hypothetical protein
MKVIAVEEIKIIPPKLEPDVNTIEVLERLLLQAKEGKLQQVIVAGVRSDRTFVTTYSDAITLSDSMFALAVLEERLKALLAAFERN